MKRLPCLKRAASAFSSAVRRHDLDCEGEEPRETGGDSASCPASASGSPLIELVHRLPADLQSRALTHSSWVARRIGSNERLEFLGDSVLGLAVASALCERYPEATEGELARTKAFVVSRASCVQVARRLNVAGLILEQGPVAPQRRREAAGSPSMVGNALEALIGACFLAHGFEQTSAAVVEAFEEQIAVALTTHVDHKTTLQEVLAPRGLQPSYRLVAEEGPPHARVFTSEVVVEGETLGRGSGTTIKMSEQRAAREALAVVSPSGEE